MKFTLVLSFLLTALSSIAQVNYFGNNPEWSQSSVCNVDACFDYRDFVYYVNGDTTVNSSTYHKIFQRGESNKTAGPTGPQCGPYETFNDLAYLVRQDGWQIYLWDGTNEVLLYDFDLAPGDTIPMTYNYSGNTFVIDSIQTVLIGGVQRNHFFFSDYISGQSSTMIEGIGWPVGFFEPVDPPVGCGYQFNCFRLDGQLEIGTGCNFEVSIPEQSLNVNIHVFPNPFEREITIQFPSEQGLTSIRLVEMNGTSYSLKSKVISEEMIQVQAVGLTPGIYLLECCFENGQIIRKKLVRR